MDSEIVDKIEKICLDLEIIEATIIVTDDVQYIDIAIRNLRQMLRQVS